MKANAKKHFTLIAGLSLALLVSLPGLVFAHGKPDRRPSPSVTAVTGQSDWSIVSVVIPSEYVTFHDDGSATIERMPLAGKFVLLIRQPERSCPRSPKTPVDKGPLAANDRSYHNAGLLN